MRDWVVSFVRALIVVIGTPRASCGTPSSSTLSSLPVVSSGCCALSGNAAAGGGAAMASSTSRRGGWHAKQGRSISRQLQMNRMHARLTLHRPRQCCCCCFITHVSKNVKFATLGYPPSTQGDSGVQVS
ncbi:hypothetical protein PF008_g27726 [Phytophthora fragariae]|uniref:Secreted protein n=1 Tax=Phytophthora fragariae TaxID=53985 RepID=A0A6G0QDB7_9STRA|nr:hypothetical protein PF008_g27726 [Phytophthora fragariae]